LRAAQYASLRRRNACAWDDALKGVPKALATPREFCQALLFPV
jgi:hypothetical protein